MANKTDEDVKTQEKSSDHNRPEKSKILEAGVDMVGAVAGASVGTFVAGPAGTIAGAAIGSIATTTVRNMSAELLSRLLGKQENIRVKRTVNNVIALIYCYESQGGKIRDDDFFEKDENGRSSADEITEGILLAAKKEYEEKKLPYIANLGAAPFFISDLTRNIGVQLIHLAEALSWQEFILLSILSENQNSNLQLREKTYAGSPQKFSDDILLNSILQDFSHLSGLGLMTNGNAGGVGLASFAPNSIKLFGAGLQIVALLKLREIPHREKQKYIDILRE